MAATRSWWRRLGDRLVRRPAPIPEPMWRALLERHPFLLRHGADSSAALRQLTAGFLADKEFQGAGGLQVTDEMALAIAAQACLPLVGVAGPLQGLAWYRDFVGIVVHPDAVRARREWTDDLGVVHQWNEELSGEAMDQGPVMLSWADVADAPASAADGYNVVVHEFIHKMDLGDGASDGCPPLPPGFMGTGSARAARQLWLGRLQAAFEDFSDRLSVHERFGGPAVWLDAYGASAIDEFFAVAAEAYFVNPERFALELPTLSGMFDAFFRARSPGA